MVTSGAGPAGFKILKKYFYDRPSYNTVEPQPYHTFFREGQRDVIGFIIEAVNRIAENSEPTKIKTNL